MQMHLEEFNVNIPVGRHHAVTSIVHVIGEIMKDWLLRSRPYIGIKRVFTKELIYRTGCDSRKELALGIGPVIRVSCLQEQRPWSNQRDQHMRIHRSLVRKPGPL